MRPFGLALLSIDTAGSGKKEIVLGGIRKSVALQLRETILSRTKAGAPACPEETEDADDKSLLLSRDVKDIVIYGLTVNVIFWVAVAVGAFFGAFDLAENFFTWLANYIQIEDVIAAVERAGGMIGAVLIVILVLLVMFLLLPLISVAGALVRHYGYRLRVEGETYRKNSGLLTRHDESMKRHKIQAMVLKQNFVARFFKRTNMQLRIASAGSCAGNGQLPTGPKTSFLVPALNDEELTKLVPEFLPGCDYSNVQFSRINRRRFSLVIIGWAVLLPLFLITGVLSLIVSWMFLFLLPIGLALAWTIVTRIWSKSGYGVVGDYGFIRHGFLGTDVTVFPLFKVQRVDIRQTPGQRRKKLAHLAIHLASHSLKISYVREQDARQLRDLALYHVESSNRAWY
jgi:putative membrane protein